ncbi:aminopeptidase P family protein [Lutibaculum baratangense]|uniref:Xaa-Pro aminopeptidase n=1 Tax=Lutibaculum baratangense AMV1 TaxID=631454 RepID=V4R5T4_9HYPH|nr:aminopeptidase P family protein [Lutibaculum baratangense]ESR27317.1 Xaa-Pro aminopeptidase [Lutibaculum baratangense AMV1]
MFQHFDETTDPSLSAERLPLLRRQLVSLRLDGFLVPRTDEYQNEYLPPSAERLAWLTGFTGSAGLGLVLATRAAVFVDGRYTIQVRQQVDLELFETPHLIADGGWEGWLRDNLTPGQRIGFDPKLHTVKNVRQLEKIARETGAEFIPVADNPIDDVWSDRPAPPEGRIEPHPVELAGRTAEDKLDEVRDVLKRANQDACVITSPDVIAWLFNIRGSDVPHTPLPLGFAVFRKEGRPTFAVSSAKLGEDARAYLGSLTEIVEPESFPGLIDALGDSHSRVRLDPAVVSQWIADRLRSAGAVVVEAADPFMLSKARKTHAEVRGARGAHQIDGVAMCRFLAWLDREAPKGGLDEIAAAKKLEALRVETGALRDLSFDAISAAGPHSAIPHYRVTTGSNRPIEPNSLYLIDSGGQYREGTTDITRTVVVGEPTPEMIHHNTLVLRGHVALATARFPVGTTGAQLDPIARYFLWQAGLDFDHGTGHGIGSYLSVHEGPQRIAKTGTVPLEPGMIVSNEPGYYRAGEYGIRIENLMVVNEAELVPGGDRPVLSFETLSFVPIDRRLIDADLLGLDARTWLNSYHLVTLERMAPHLDDADRAWLEQATEAI